MFSILPLERSSDSKINSVQYMAQKIYQAMELKKSREWCENMALLM